MKEREDIERVGEDGAPREKPHLGRREAWRRRRPRRGGRRRQHARPLDIAQAGGGGPLVSLYFVAAAVLTMILIFLPASVYAFQIGAGDGVGGRTRTRRRGVAFEPPRLAAAATTTVHRRGRPTKLDDGITTKVRTISRRDELWEERLTELRRFVDEHGHADVTKSYGSSLAGWAARQRREYASFQRGDKSSMTPERMEKLVELGFRWATARGPRVATEAREERWEARLDELKRWKAETGHADVPEQPDDARWRELANWVKAQRAEYSKYQKERSADDGNGSEPTVVASTMTPERIAKLVELGFTWDVHDRLWENRFAELEDFCSDDGHCNVPLSHGSLGDWVQKIRIDYKRIQSGREPTNASLITPERLERLERLRFDFDPHATQFQSYLSQLRQFRKEHGHIDVGTKRGKLSTWYYRQRTLYKKLLSGSTETGLTPSRRQALEDVGFEPAMFEPRTYRTGPIIQYGSDAVAPRAKFEERLDELREYVSENGHANVPWSEGPLGRWVKEQRFNCRNETRVEELNDLGFIWDVRNYVWWSRFRELEEYSSENGHVNVPHSAGELGEWVTQQRRRRKQGLRLAESSSEAVASSPLCDAEEDPSDEAAREKCEDRLEDARRSALDSVGFVWDRGEEIRTSREEMWNDKFEALRKYRDIYGDSRVPVGHDASLCYWVNVQRRAFRFNNKGGNGKGGMSEQRRKKLESIEFD